MRSLIARCYQAPSLHLKQTVTKGAMLFVQGDFTPHQYTAEDGKQGLSLEVNIEKFSFADESKPQGNGQ